MYIWYILPRRGSVSAMAIWPLILAKRSQKDEGGLPEQVIYHERIHHRQQLEMGILPFYCWYLLEWLWKLVIYKSRKRAYRALSFEREAYAFERQYTYLKYRKSYSFIRYL